jgi:hypothetical protein
MQTRSHDRHPMQYRADGLCSNASKQTHRLDIWLVNAKGVLERLCVLTHERDADRQQLGHP